MAQTHYRELRLRTPDGPVSAELVARARKAVGIAEQHRAFQDLRHFRRLFTYPDGVTIEALWDGTLWIATIRGQRPAVIEPVRIPRPPIWVPRGFVVLPASDARPAGWGLPVTPAPDTEGPFDPANLVPGLDVARWNPSGPLGEVLLTRLPDAGYPGVGPGAITVPLLWHREYGPQPPQDDDGRWLLNLPPLNPTWSAHRISFEAYRAQQPGLTPEQAAAIAAEKRALFERINLFRETAGRLPLTPPVRGYADTAQASADQAAAAQVLGAWAAAYDPTWRIEGDRLARDGISSRAAAGDDRNATANGVQVQTARTTAAPTTIGTDPVGQPILDIAGGGPPITGEQAADDFEASGYAAAQLLGPAWDAQPGSGSALNVGIRDNVAVAHVVRRESWIETGNRQWISSDPAIPMLSWWGAAGLNLADETYPRTGTTPPVGSDPEDQALEFSLWDPHTLNRSSLYDPDGFCYLRHVYSDPHLPPEAWRVQPFWEGRIFCRGRCIAIVPNNGLVWAAAIRRTTAGGYQLVALVHDPDDEPANLAQARSEGLTRWVRLWRCDLPDVEGLVATPEVCIRGVRGATPVWPWDDPDDPYAWTDGQAIDVGTSDGATRDLLVLASQWTFAPDGNSAACARTWGRYPEAWRTERGTPRYEQETSLFSWNTFGFGTIFDHTPRPGVLRLTLTDSSVTRVWDGFPLEAAPQYAAPGVPAPRAPTQLPEAGPWIKPALEPWPSAWPDLVAVDWAPDGLRFALIAYSRGTVQDFDLRFNHHTYAVAFTAALSTAAADWAPAAIEYGQVAVKPGSEHLGVVVANAGVLVLGCAAQALVSIGTVPRFLRERAIPTSDICADNPAYVLCWADEVDLPWFAVNAWVGGQRVLSRWHPNPDRVQVNNLYLCHDDGINGDPQVQLLMRTIIRPHFARADGAWLLAYTVQPQDGNRAVVSVAGDCPEFFNGGTGTIYQSACTPRFSDLGTLAHGEHRVAGAGAAASFANEDTLMSLMQIPGQGRRLLHVGAA